MNSNNPDTNRAMRQSQTLLNEVVSLVTDLLAAAGASSSMISNAMSNAVAHLVEEKSKARFTELGSLKRDCMEVMCAWRRCAALVDDQGLPRPLKRGRGEHTFDALCRSVDCGHDPSEILNALLEFGSVKMDKDHHIISCTPTFLLTRADSQGSLATDGLLKQLEGFLRVLHRNVRSVSGSGVPRFERACTVAVAAEIEPIFAQLVRARGQEFVDSIDEWLERNARQESRSSRYVELGVGAYFIDLGGCARKARRMG